MKNSKTHRLTLTICLKNWKEAGSIRYSTDFKQLFNSVQIKFSSVNVVDLVIPEGHRFGEQFGLQDVVFRFLLSFRVKHQHTAVEIQGHHQVVADRLCRLIVLKFVQHLPVQTLSHHSFLARGVEQTEHDQVTVNLVGPHSFKILQAKLKPECGILKE